MGILSGVLSEYGRRACNVSSPEFYTPGVDSSSLPQFKAFAAAGNYISVTFTDEDTGEVIWSYPEGTKVNKEPELKKEDDTMEKEVKQAVVEELENEDREVIGYCEECGEPIYEGDDYEEDDGKYYCRSCFDNENVFICHDCGHIYSLDRRISVNENWPEDQFYVCRICADEYYKCEDCGEYFTNDHLYNEDDWGVAICDDCGDHWYTCDDCGCLVHEDNVYVDRHENHYCESCFYDNCHNRSAGYVWGYHDRDEDFEFHGEYKPNQMYLGVELETDKGDNYEAYSEDLYELSDSESLFYQMEDGSLRNGIEIISQPCTLDYHLNEFPWEDIAQVARRYDFKSHDAGTCGLHVHVSCAALGETGTEQDLTKAKIAILFDHLWEQLVKFSRRSNFEYCAKLNANVTNEDSETVAVAKTKSVARGHYRALNMSNYHTLEFRIFRGTLNVNTIKATLEFVSGMTHYCLDHTLQECLDASWADVAQYEVYPELETYLKQRDLWTETAASDAVVA